MDDRKLKDIESKKQKLDYLKPLSQELIDNLEDWFKVELTYSSNAIEGNTLSRVETAEVLERGVSAVISGKSLKDQLEAINHAKALEYIKELVQKRGGHQFITENDIKNIQKIILTGIHDDWAGVYRQAEIFIRGSNAEFPLPSQVPKLMKEFVRGLQEKQEGNPVIIAADSHFKLVSIHPFRDGNGRTARLLMNLILTAYDYPMAVIRNEDRTEYLAVFDKVRETNNMQPFYIMIETAVERSLDAYINAASGKKVMGSLMNNTGSKGKKLLRIGNLAKETGESVFTLRYWLKEGILKVANYTKGGYQLFDRAMIERSKKIRELQEEKRLTIAEIRTQLNKKVGG